MRMEQVLRLAPSGPQLGLIVALAAALTLAIGVVMWAMRPSMVALSTELRGQSLQEAVNLLRQRGVEYELRGDMLLVPRDKELMLRNDLELRTLLQSPAGDLPQELVGGSELTQSERDKLRLAVARKQKRLEDTIAKLRDVQSARVTLAVPQQPVFLKRNRTPSASVNLRLMPGRVLDGAQVQGIVGLVASAVEGLEESRVKITDGRGRQLNHSDGASSQRQKELRHKQDFEDMMLAKVETFLDSTVGPGNYRAQVDAQIDFSTIVETRVRYDSKGGAVVSQQIEREGSDKEAVNLGVPGALTNQPPDGGTLVQQGENGASDGLGGTYRFRETRNENPSKTDQHLQGPSWKLQRLNLAVVIGDRVSVDDAGEAVRTPWQQAELDKLTEVLKTTISIDEARGDVVSLVNQALVLPAVLPEPPVQQVWEQSWFEQVVKSALAGLALLLLVLMVIRPTARALLGRVVSDKAAAADSAAGDGEEGGGESDTPLLESDRVSLSTDGDDLLPPPSRVHGDILNLAREMATQDPKRMATVLKKWMDTDE
jgi:flagellar M-ring protein FliF